ncbi:hypothetical protein Nepgr_022808 [Nepenthes gracilis]|uniref:Uncharacterized protein n=1 Tax=Nepenthes gracilis TaxID=150966 RepID=A0AAD3T1M7_NEPGR|nr:hypothetical protein Nepgr_022808 [Nepenthes gracilis]
MAALGQQHTNMFADKEPDPSSTAYTSQISVKTSRRSLHRTASPIRSNQRSKFQKSYSKTWPEQPKTSLEQQYHNSKNPRDAPTAAAESTASASLQNTRLQAATQKLQQGN